MTPMTACMTTHFDGRLALFSALFFQSPGLRKVRKYLMVGYLEDHPRTFCKRLTTIRDRVVSVPNFWGVMGPLPNGLNCSKKRGHTNYTVLTKWDDLPSMVGEAGG